MKVLVGGFCCHFLYCTRRRCLSLLSKKCPHFEVYEVEYQETWPCLLVWKQTHKSTLCHLYKNKIWTSDSRLLLLENSLCIHSLVVVTLQRKKRQTDREVCYFMETDIAAKAINILHGIMIEETHLDLLTCTSSPPTRVLVVVRTLLLSFLVNLPFSMSPSISHMPWWRKYTVSVKSFLMLFFNCVSLSNTTNVCLLLKSNTHCSFYSLTVAVIIHWNFSIASSLSFSSHGLQPEMQIISGCTEIMKQHHDRHLLV